MDYLGLYFKRFLDKLLNYSEIMKFLTWLFHCICAAWHSLQTAVTEIVLSVLKWSLPFVAGIKWINMILIKSWYYNYKSFFFLSVQSSDNYGVILPRSCKKTYYISSLLSTKSPFESNWIELAWNDYCNYQLFVAAFVSFCLKARWQV